MLDIDYFITNNINKSHTIFFFFFNAVKNYSDENNSKIIEFKSLVDCMSQPVTFFASTDVLLNQKLNSKLESSPGF